MTKCHFARPCLIFSEYLEENIDKVYSSCKEYKKIAQIRGEDEEIVREQLQQNATALYKIKL